MPTSSASGSTAASASSGLGRGPGGGQGGVVGPDAADQQGEPVLEAGLAGGRAGASKAGHGRAQVGQLAGLLGAELAAATARQGPAVLDAPVAVLTVAEAKGLEFDAVVVADPAAILATGGHGGHGANDLYVALTRATARLGVVHPAELPAVLARLMDPEFAGTPTGDGR